MATTAKKITLSSSRDIPFNQLVISQANVRRIKAGVSIEELAEDIARRTLLQSITVRPVRDADGSETGRMALPTMPMAAALSAAHLSAILFPDTLRRLYIARDNDPAGDGAMATLIERANAAGIEAIVVSPRMGDFNEDLRLAGLDSLRAAARVQIAPQDVARFMQLAA